MLILLIILIITVILAFISTIKRAIGFCITCLILGLCFIAWKGGVQTPGEFVDVVKTTVLEGLPKSSESNMESDTGDRGSSSNTNENGVESNRGSIQTSDGSELVNGHTHIVLTGHETSSTTEGAVKYGATFALGDLDNLKRATFAHIRVRDDQEPGSNDIKRPERIVTNPAGWSNPDRTNDRTHLVGFQFSGVNSDPRNLVTATAYLNRGVEKSGSDENNPDSMLFYEQRLDTWLRENPDKYLDLYVAPVYDGNNLVPKEIIMSWVGVGSDGTLIPIETHGHTSQDGAFRNVRLKNQLKTNS